MKTSRSHYAPQLIWGAYFEAKSRQPPLFIYIIDVSFANVVFGRLRAGSSYQVSLSQLVVVLEVIGLETGAAGLLEELSCFFPPVIFLFSS